MSERSGGSVSSGVVAEPAWDIAHLFPLQGAWAEDDYFEVSRGNRMVELSQGRVEVLPMPTMRHQQSLAYLCGSLHEFVTADRLGMVIQAPFRVRLWPGTIREPDVVFMLAEHIRQGRAGEEFWHGADLVMEIVLEAGRHRDLEVKRIEYARAGIAEYWIVDPRERRITVLNLDGETYKEHGAFRRGEVATSVLLPGFSVRVDGAFSADE